LRGRVGRSNKKAFCYLFTPPITDLTPEARRRLRAIEEFSDLGSGFNIAMQDLDIRGAGNLMGAEQSGFIAEIGFETYHRILNEAMAELKEEGFELDKASEPETQNSNGAALNDVKPETFVADCQIDADLELLFPDSYIENVSERIRMYRALDNTDTEVKLAEFERELVDRFGAIPDTSRELINVIRLRWLAARLGFEKITLRNEQLLAYFVSNQKSPYYESTTFRKILQYVQQNPRLFKMKEVKDKLTMSVSSVKTIGECMEVLEKF